MKLKCRYFRAALRYLGMAVGDDQYSQGLIGQQRFAGFDGNGRWNRLRGFGRRCCYGRNERRVRLRRYRRYFGFWRRDCRFWHNHVHRLNRC